MPFVVSSLFKKYPKIKLAASRLYACVPARLRTSRHFIDWLSFYRAAEFWNDSEHEEYQVLRVRQLIAALKTKSDYYRTVLDGISADDINSLSDFRRLIPVMDRETYRENYDRILNQKADLSNCKSSATSGTTGLALHFYHTREDNAREWASICHQWMRVGFDPLRSIRAEFRGLTIRPGGIDAYPHENFIRVDISNMNRETVTAYADAMLKNNVEFYHGYPSAISSMADIVIEHNIRFPAPKAFLLASEMMHDWQLEKIRQAFPGTPVYAHYGCAERTVLAGWCERSEEYHAIPSYSITEIDENTGEIIGTNLHNTVNGFLRYKMTDTAASSSTGPCPLCLRSYSPRISGLNGRMEDYLFSRQRGWVPPALITYPFKGLKAIGNTQIHQNIENKINIVYMTHNESSDADIAGDQESLRNGLKMILGDSVSVSFEHQSVIQKTAAGKYKWVISTLPRDLKR